MNQSAQLSVELNGEVVERGTAFLHQDHVVTAFHVVGSTESGLWRHDLQSGVEYVLHSDGRVQLQPVLANSVADLALLRSTRSPALSPLVLTPPNAMLVGREWRTIGFPPSVDEGAYALDGAISQVRSWGDARGMQLYVNQGTKVDWSGISGAPVIVDGQVAGIVTETTPDASTAWACTAFVLRRLLQTLEANLVEQVASLLPSAFAVPEELADFLNQAEPSMVVRWYVERLRVKELIENIRDISGPQLEMVRRLLAELDQVNSEPSWPPIWAGSTAGTLFARASRPIHVPDLLTPSHDDRAGELRRLFGTDLGRELVSLSGRAINAIEYGQFQEYIEVGQAIRRVGYDAGSSELIGDGTSLIADGHRLLAGLNNYDQSELLQLAKDNFEHVLELTPGNCRAQRGLACCEQAEFNFGDALRRIDLAIDAVRRQIVTPSGATEPESRRLGNRHELLRLVRHRTDVILRIRASSPQSHWNSEVGTNTLAQLVADHERLFRTTMKNLTAHSDWHHFECFASLIFLAGAWFELGDSERAGACALSALRHRRATMRGSLPDIQFANLKWWLQACRVERLAQQGLVGGVEQLTDAVHRGDAPRALHAIDHILSTAR